MNKPEIFSATLGLSSPWRISSVDISSEERRIDFQVECVQHGDLTCACCGSKVSTADGERETWIHRDYFGYIAYIHALVPSLSCECCGAQHLERPWAGAQSHFTLVN